MHIEKRKSGKSVKFYLAHSFREGKHVHKFRKYLGAGISQDKLRERRKIAEKLILEEIHKYNIIKDPLQFELSGQDVKDVKALEMRIPIKVSHLSEQDWNSFSELFTYNTNAIEGSRLTQKDVNEIFQKDKWPEKSKEDIAEAYGVREAIRYIRSEKEHISIFLIKNIHRIVFKNSKPFAGKLRKKGEEVVVMDNKGNVIHEGAPQSRISHLLNELIDWYNKNKNVYPALILGSVVHNQFENIHPFRDGNGRVGRILLNNILINHGLPPVNIEFKDRQKYYETLRDYEQNKDIMPTIHFYMKQYQYLKTKRKK